MVSMRIKRKQSKKVDEVIITDTIVPDELMCRSSHSKFDAPEQCSSRMSWDLESSLKYCQLNKSLNSMNDSGMICNKYLVGTKSRPKRSSQSPTSSPPKKENIRTSPKSDRQRRDKCIPTNHSILSALPDMPLYSRRMAISEKFEASSPMDDRNSSNHSSGSLGRNSSRGRGASRQRSPVSLRNSRPSRRSPFENEETVASPLDQPTNRRWRQLAKYCRDSPQRKQNKWAADEDSSSDEYFIEAVAEKDPNWSPATRRGAVINHLQ